MKIASVFASMPGNQSGLISVKNIVSETLTDLGIEPEEINLGYRSLPYYDGIKSEYMNTIADVLRTSNGIIFYVSASYGLPGALAQTLFEHFSYPEYEGILNNKNCFVIMNCDDNTGATAMSAMDLAIYNMGAFSGARILVDKRFMDKMEQESKNYTLIERLCEDYYRALRQQRIMYRPGEAFMRNQTPPQFPIGKAASNAEVKYEEKLYSNVSEPDVQQPLNGMTLREMLLGQPPVQDSMPVQAVYEPKPVQPPTYEPKAVNIAANDNFTNSQQKDIDEISKFFAQKFKANDEEKLEYNEIAAIPSAPAIQKTTLAQKTSALTHYFKAGQSDGLKAVVSLNISGKDGFEGYIEINGADCDFNMGQANAADVSIIAEDNKWSEIIKGKTSAQKAFMIGQIKVRGNFVLLSKFDQLFDFGKNND